MGKTSEKLANVGTPFTKMPFEEQQKFLGGKLPTQVVKENTYLKNFSASDVAKHIFGDSYGDSWVNEPSVNGNTNFTKNEDKIAKDKATFIYSVVNGSSTPSEVMKQAIQAGLYQESIDKLKHLTNEERKQWIEDNTERAAAEKFDDILNTKIASIENDPKRRFSTTAQSASKIKISTPYLAKNGSPDYNTAKENFLNLVEKDKEVAKETKNYNVNGVIDFDAAISNVKENGVGNTTNLINKLQKAKKARDEQNLLADNGLYHSLGGVDVSLKGLNDYMTIDGQKVKGSVNGVKEYSDNEGKRRIALLIGTPDANNRVITNVALLDEPINKGSFETDSGGKDQEIINSVSKKSNEILSSQGKKEGVKDAGYETWKKSLPSNLQNENDYDLEGFYNQNKGTEKLKPNANMHLDDGFKKPNHITFSKESKYSNNNNYGGEWKGSDAKGWTFEASPYNVAQHTPKEMNDYFKKYEKKSKVSFPNYNEMETVQKQAILNKYKKTTKTVTESGYNKWLKDNQYIK